MKYVSENMIMGCLIVLIAIFLGACSKKVKLKSPDTCVATETELAVEIRCPDGTVVTLPHGEDGVDGVDGIDGVDGESCSVDQLEDGIYILCPDSDAFIPWEDIEDEDSDSDDDSDDDKKDKKDKKNKD